jgi:hypothetical protein
LVAFTVLCSHFSRTSGPNWQLPLPGSVQPRLAQVVPPFSRLRSACFSSAFFIPCDASYGMTYLRMVRMRILLCTMSDAIRSRREDIERKALKWAVAANCRR